MSLAIITGSSGLVGSETARFLHDKGFDVVGIDNDMRKYFFDASVAWNTQKLQNDLARFKHHDIDIRDEAAIGSLFARYGTAIGLIVHAAAQPSHDWAAREPLTDFSVNANGTLNMLEACRQHCPEATFIFTSTNKVYGDTPNALPLVEHETRWELNQEHAFAEHGIDESMSIDQTKHSLFGASKVAPDILVQEYGRYFGLRTGIFRGGCLTGPAHSGAELHGFLAYLVQCCFTGRPYTVFGYKGKQVRDNIHSYDLANAFFHFYENPRPAATYNIGGSRFSNCSVLEAIQKSEKLCGRSMNFPVSDTNRIGDHIWYVSDVRKFQHDYPEWKYKYSFDDILAQIADAVRERFGEQA